MCDNNINPNITIIHRLTKDILCKLVTTIESDIRYEIENEWVCGNPDTFKQTKELFNKALLNPIEHQNVLSEMCSELIQQLRMHPVSMKVSYFNNDTEIDIEWDEYDEYDANQLAKEKEWYDTHNQWDSIVIEDVKRVVAINLRGSNTDSRCGGPDIDTEEFVLEKRCKTGNLTLYEFVEIVYRLKSSKYDYWYELYCGLTTHYDEMSKTLYMNVRFDHGS